MGDKVGILVIRLNIYWYCGQRENKLTIWSYKIVKKNNKLLLMVAWSMLSLGLLISIYLIFSTAIDGYCIWGKDKINFELTGQFGDFFGGVVGTFFALTGTLLIFFNFNEQTKQNKKEGFEAKFYEMLRLHKENINEIHVNNKKGREAIEYLIKSLHTLFNEVESAVDQLITLKNSNTYDYLSPQILLQIKNYLSNETQRKLLTHRLSYGYFFYSVQKYYITKDRNNIIYAINLFVNQTIESNRLNVSEDPDLSVNIHYNALLGHYFRHLYQMIKLVANEKILDEDEKYEFTKIVRAQLSDNEQILLYYNSLSIMGEKWITPLHEKQKEKMCFIARFKLIKNIPYYFNYFGMKPGNLFEIEKEALEKKGDSFFETNLDV